ncbi:hypothetical protein LTR17_021872 [Elasticomyces elasticus]|nr:hypothetical protein LTR17_021872 [Elasticomyces elasticus]
MATATTIDDTMDDTVEGWKRSLISHSSTTPPISPIVRHCAASSRYLESSAIKFTDICCVTSSYTASHTTNVLLHLAINAEANEVLSSNHFVVISAQWTGLDQDIHLHSVPIVCEDSSSVSSFRQHHLRVHLQHPVKAARGPTLVSFVVVAADLPIFCAELMQWKFLMTPSPSGLLVNASSGDQDKHSKVALRLSKKTPFRVQTKLQLLSTKTKAMTTILESALLAPFSRMIIGQQKISLMNTTQAQDEIDGLQALMGPLHVSFAPMIWRAFGIAEQIKSTADQLLVQGDIKRALLKYTLLSTGAPQLHVLKFPPEEIRCDTQIAMALLMRKVMDAGATAGFIQLRLGDMAGAYKVFQEVLAMEDRIAELPNQELLCPNPIRYRQAVNWFMALTAFVTDIPLDALTEIRGRLFTLVAEVENTPYLPELRHDIIALTNVMADKEKWVAMQSEDRLDLLSVRHFDVQIVDTPVPDGWTEPESYDGFLEEGHKVYLRANGFL